MAVISDIGGTSQSSFSINGKTTLFQGDDLPNPLMGNNGDVYFKSEGLLYIKRNGVWEEWTKDSVPDARSYQNRLLYSNGENYDFAEITYNEDNKKELKLMNNLPNDVNGMEVPNLNWVENRLTYKKIKEAAIGDGTVGNFTETYYDKDNNTIGSEKVEINNTNGQSVVSLTANSQNSEAKLELIANDDGTSYLKATTPPAYATGNEIATIEWISHNTSSKKLGELVWSPVPINDSGLKLLNGQRLAKLGYEDFWNHLKNLYDSGSYTHIHYENNDNETITRDVSQKGHFFINNSYVWLPDFTDVVTISPTSNNSEVGEHKEPGLPNIEGTINNLNQISGESGVFAWTGGSWHAEVSGGDSQQHKVSFDASRSSPVYGSSNVVQPEAVKTFVYIVVLTNIIGDVAQLYIDELVNKLTNCINNGVKYPDFSAIIDITKNSQDQIVESGIIEEDGWIQFCKDNLDAASFNINNVLVQWSAGWASYPSGDIVTLPVKAGDTWSFGKSVNGTRNAKVYFFPNRQ